MNRHRQKDAEAGTEGTGVLNTRKRMWRDEEGNIVTKRPAIKNDESSRSMTVATEEPNGSLAFDRTVPISPPTSTSNSDRLQHEPTNFEFTALEGPLNPLHISPLPPESDIFWSDAVQGTAVGTENAADILYDDIFQPDTASSFNNPFTTMSAYNWLFDVDFSSKANNPTGLETFQTNENFLEQPINGKGAMQIPYEAIGIGAVESEFQRAGEAPSSCSRDSVSQHSGLSPHTTSGYSTGVTQYSSSVGHLERPKSNTECQSLSPAKRENTESARLPASRQSTGQGFAATPSSQRPLDNERPLSMLNSTHGLPIIDALARAHMLDLIETANPTTPDGTLLTRDHPLLSLSSLQTYCDLYFTRFNTAYPLIHQATFEPSKVDALFLISVLLLGATYSGKEAHQIAVSPYDVSLRRQL